MTKVKITVPAMMLGVKYNPGSRFEAKIFDRDYGKVAVIEPELNALYTFQPNEFVIVGSDEDHARSIQILAKRDADFKRFYDAFIVIAPTMKGDKIRTAMYAAYEAGRAHEGMAE